MLMCDSIPSSQDHCITKIPIDSHKIIRSTWRKNLQHVMDFFNNIITSFSSIKSGVLKSSGPNRCTW
jgi:hypothetical protein